jgi:hypothetical protein
LYSTGVLPICWIIALGNVSGGPWVFGFCILLHETAGFRVDLILCRESSSASIPFGFAWVKIRLRGFFIADESRALPPHHSKFLTGCRFRVRCNASGRKSIHRGKHMCGDLDRPFVNNRGCLLTLPPRSQILNNVRLNIRSVSSQRS